MHLEAVIEVLGDSLGCHDVSRFEKYLEAIGQQGGATGAEVTLFIA